MRGERAEASAHVALERLGERGGALHSELVRAQVEPPVGLGLGLSGVRGLTINPNLT